MDKNTTPLREDLADFAHKQWASWMKYLFEQGEYNGDGTWTMPEWAVERWTRQILTDYVDLSQSEQNSDRRQADKMLLIIAKHVDIP